MNDIDFLTQRVDELSQRLEQQADRYDNMIRDLERRLSDEVYDRERGDQRLEDKCGELERNQLYGN